MGCSYKDTKHAGHILCQYHYVRKGEENGQHMLIHVPMEKQLVDIGTKPLGHTTLDYHT